MSYRELEPFKHSLIRLIDKEFEVLLNSEDELTSRYMNAKVELGSLRNDIAQLIERNENIQKENEELRDKLAKSVSDNIELNKQCRSMRVSKSKVEDNAYALGYLAAVNEARIALKAEADIKRLTADGKDERTVGYQRGNGTYKYCYYKVRFVISPQKCFVLALVKNPTTGKLLEKGIAKCHPNDTFNESIGKAIALRRALGLEVPSEYLGG